MSTPVSGYVMLNIFSSLILLMILNWKTIRVGISLDQKLFDLMVLVTLLLLLTDTAMWVLNGRQGNLFRIINISVTLIYYICHPLLLSLWTLYSDYSLFGDREKTERLALVLSAINLVFVFFIFASIRYGYIFNVDENNVYSRGNCFSFFFAGSYSLVIYAFLVILINRKRAERGIIRILLLFALFPTAAGIFQASMYGITIVWPSMALSILMIYIYIQNSHLTTDYLTGIINRRQFESILNRKILSGHTGFSLIMLDLDDFKTINDRYGHCEGDHALELAVKILRDSLRTGDIIARYAGDEFLVLLESEDKSGLEAAVQRIRRKTEDWNAGKSSPYVISFSMGYEVFKPHNRLSLEEVIGRVDLLMYEEKKIKKSL